MHDFNPGIEDSGLFWTVPVSNGSVDIDEHKGKARFRVNEMKIPDFGNFFNSLSDNPDPPPVPSKVSFDVRWAGGGDATPVDDSTFGFRGQFIAGPATITFKARAEHSDVEYRSDKDDQTTPNGPAGVGSEQNGVFYT